MSRILYYFIIIIANTMLVSPIQADYRDIWYETENSADLQEANETERVINDPDITTVDQEFLASLTIPETVYWLNGIHAILTTYNRDDILLYGGRERESWAVKRQVTALEDWWGIYDREDLLEMVEKLTQGLHNPRFLEDVEYYGLAWLTEKELQELLAEYDDSYSRDHLENLYTAYYKYGENAIMGWDLSRAVQLLADGYMAGYLDYEESVDLAITVGEQLQKTFGSWEEFLESYMCGYLYWSGDDKNDADDAYMWREIIMEGLLDDPNSPYHLSWYMDLEN